MKNLPTLLCLAILLAACKHPLEIEGEGDIESSTGVNDCALEDQPCENEVTGEYVVSYTGVPRPGWSFLGWQNCGTQFPNCSFSITPAVVQQFAGQTMPPLRARFLKQTPLNDTGVTFSGGWPSGNDLGCTVGLQMSQQDCKHGRDATANDNSDGHAGFSYTKLAIDGTPLPASAAQWSCVQDNVTGLVWEAKTTDGGIHDVANTYRWGGVTVQGSGYGTYYPDWDSLVNGSNATAFCGFTDWRVPTRSELLSLVNYNVSTAPVIDSAYFPMTAWALYWTATPEQWQGTSLAFVVDFWVGESGWNRRDTYARVRLVRAQQ